MEHDNLSCHEIVTSLYEELSEIRKAQEHLEALTKEFGLGVFALKGKMDRVEYDAADRELYEELIVKLRGQIQTG